MNHTRTIASLLTLLAVGCAASAPALTPANGTRPPTAEPATATADVAPSTVDLEPAPAAQPTGPGVALCDVVCEQAFVEPVSDSDGAEDFSRATKNANEVLESAKPELLACLGQRVRGKPQSQPFMTLSIIVGSDGKVQEVKTTEGAPVSPRAVRCLDERARKLSFQPPRGHGTMRVEVPFTLRKATDAE